MCPSIYQENPGVLWGLQREGPFFRQPMNKHTTEEINEQFRADLDSTLRSYKKLTRSYLINVVFFRRHLSKCRSLRQKKLYIDDQIRLINDECMEANGFEKYELRKGYNGGIFFTQKYLDFVVNQAYYLMDEIKAEEEEVFNTPLESRIERIEKLLKEIRTIIRQG